jgi:drug/metabolite transporter (DMT)-like permease
LARGLRAGRVSGPAAMTDTTPSQRRRAVAMLVLATLYWGVSFPVIKSLSLLNHALVPAAGTWFLAAAATSPRFLVAAAIMVALRGRGVRATRAELRQGLGIGLFASAGTLLQTDGLQFTEASTSAFLTQFSAILIPIWIALRSRRNPGWVVWAGCVLVLAGVAILGHFEWRTLHFGRGEWETLLCSLFYMGQILWLERGEFAGTRPAEITRIMFLVEASVFTAVALGTAPSLHALAVPWSSGPWLGLTLVLATVCTLGAFSIMNRWQPKVTATEAGLVYCVEPVFAAVFALFLPAIFAAWASVTYANEHATASLLVGGTLITAANLLVLSKPMKGKPMQ